MPDANLGEQLRALRVDHTDECDVYMAWSGNGKCDCGAEALRDTCAAELEKLQMLLAEATEQQNVPCQHCHWSPL